MFLLDSLMISGIRWALETALTAAEAEMNDDSVLREQLIETELRREMGELSDEEFADIEADLLRRIREIKERREGGSGPLAFGGPRPLETADGGQFTVEASVAGDFHDPAATPHTTVIETTPGVFEQVSLMDMAPGDAAPAVEPAQVRHVKRRPARPARKRSPGRRASAARAASTTRTVRPRSRK